MVGLRLAPQVFAGGDGRMQRLTVLEDETGDYGSRKSQ
jgi:hypothetical protein